MQFWSCFNAVSKKTLLLCFLLKKWILLNFWGSWRNCLEDLEGPILKFLSSRILRKFLPVFLMNFVVISFLPWTWCKSRPWALMKVCLAIRLLTVKILCHLSASGSKHSAVFFRFIFNTRTSFRRQFFFCNY